MYGFVVLLLVAYGGFRLVRYFVWRGRFSETKGALASQWSQVIRLTERVDALQAEIAELRRTGVTVPAPVTTGPVEVAATAAVVAEAPQEVPVQVGAEEPVTVPVPVMALEQPVPEVAQVVETVAVGLPEESQIVVQPRAGLNEVAETAVPELAKEPEPAAEAPAFPWDIEQPASVQPVAQEPAPRAASVWDLGRPPSVPAAAAFKRDAIGQAVGGALSRLRPSAAADDAEPKPVASPSPTVGDRIRSAFDEARGNEGLEALIGTSWLNKIGVAVLVIGIALLSGYSLQYLPAIGKLALGAAFALGLLGLGVWLERKERFTLFARPLIGGGWALLYFIAYAGRAIPASRIFTDDTQGFIALFIVAAGMIAHSLKYRSEMVTGMAYLLGFLAILIGGLQLTSLVPIGLLAASFLVIFRFIPWYRLSVGMMVATYAALWLWMTGNAPAGPVPETLYWLIQSILAVYWLMFAAIDYMRRPEQPQQQALQGFGVGFNTVAFTVLSAIMASAAYPAGLHLFAAAVAVGTLAAGLLAAARARRFSYLFHVLFAGGAAAIALPLTVSETGLAGEWLGIGWTVLAAVLFAAGLRLKEPLFRTGGYVAATLGTVAAFGIGVLATRLGPIAPSGDLTLRFISIAIVGAALIAGEWVMGARREQLGQQEQGTGRALGAAGVFLLAAGVPAAVLAYGLAAEWLALGWLALAVILFALGLFRQHGGMRTEAYFVAGLAAVATIIFPVLALSGFGGLASSGDLGLRLTTIAVVAIALMAGEWIVSTRRGTGAGEAESAAAGSWLGAMLLVAAVWVGIAGLGIAGEWLAVGWLVLAGLLFAVSARRGHHVQVRFEGYAVAALATAAAFIVGVFSAPLGGIVPADLLWLRVFTVGVVALALLGAEWLSGAFVKNAGETERRLAPLTGYAGVALLFALALRDVPADWLGLAWLAGGLVSFELGLSFGHPHARNRGYLLMVAAMGALFVNNSGLVFLHVHPVEGWASAVPLAFAAIGYWFAGFRLWRVAAERVTAVEKQWTPVLFHAGTLVAATLLWNELPESLAGLGWAALALVTHLLSTRLKIAAFRHQAYVLVALAWGRVLLVDLAAPAMFGPLSSRLLAGLPVAALLYAFRHAQPLRSDDGPVARLEAQLMPLLSFAATLLLFALARAEFGDTGAVVAVAGLAIVLLAAGVRTTLWDYRIEAYILGVLVFLGNLGVGSDFGGDPAHRMAVTVPVLVVLGGLSLLWRQQRATLAATLSEPLRRPMTFADTQSRPLFAALAVALAAIELNDMLDGSAVTIAWTIVAVVAIGIGFVLKERPFRLLGLALLALCLLKGFIVDLGDVDTIFRIISFIVLGLILLAISFVYTRYRHVLKNYI